jgi:hypothetical protein
MSVLARPRRVIVAVVALTMVAAIVAVAAVVSHGRTHGSGSPSGSSASGASTIVPLAPVKPHNTLFGVDVSTPYALEQATDEFGRMPVIRAFYKGLPPADAWTNGAVAANKSAVVVSFSASPATILSGSADATLAHFFDTAPTGHPIYWSFDHEPEHLIEDHKFSAAAYRAAWAHIGAIAAKADNTELHGTLILTAWTLNPISKRDWKNYYAPSAVSVLGFDDYPPGTIGDHDPQAVPPDQFMSAEISVAQKAGLGVGFPEFALATPAGRPAWLAAIATYLRTHGVLFAIYFNAPGAGQMTDAASIASLRHIIASSRAKKAKQSPATSPSSAASTGTVAG